MEPLSREQIRAVDRLAVERYGMSGLVLMENAGRGCVDVMERCGIAGPVVVCCGRGNNGGDGFVIARRLELLGHSARTLIWDPPDRFRGDAATNLQILLKAGLPVVKLEAGDEVTFAGAIRGADWLVDALLGTGATGSPRSPYDFAIHAMNASAARTLAVDLPSGLDCDTGAHSDCVVRADHTCTFVAPKPGLLAERAAALVGALHVVDIGAPPAVIEAALQEAP